MTRVRIREISGCPKNPLTTIVLEDLRRETTLTFYADRNEASRLRREVARRGCGCHPIYDFVQALLLVLDGELTRVVLDDAGEQGIGGRAFVRCGDGEIGVPCYPPDALALALRAKVPIYVTAEALARSIDQEPLPDATPWLARVRPGDFSIGTGDASGPRLPPPSA